ncbi:hypothetical protein RB195_013879 [Necator americanus]|uniref:Uncharacterized protein n=1 Tax=Necator americanus TaxID=51031 RepID=A0ABR1DZ56_NECAM
MKELDYVERELSGRLSGYFWRMVYQNEELYSNVDVAYWRIPSGKHQHLGRASEGVTENHLRFFGHVMRRPFHRPEDPSCSEDVPRIGLENETKS